MTMLMKLFDRNGNDRNTAHSAHAGAAHAGAAHAAVSFDWRLSTLDTTQDFLCKLGMKPRVEI